MSVSDDDTRRVGDSLNINWDVVPVETFQKALSTELEHTDITHGDLMTTGRIALAHLREDPDYYARLARVEAEAETYWSTRDKPSPTLGGGVSAAKASFIVLVAIVVLVIAIVAYFALQYWKNRGFYPLSKPGLTGGPRPNAANMPAIYRGYA